MTEVARASRRRLDGPDLRSAPGAPPGSHPSDPPAPSLALVALRKALRTLPGRSA
ncbi:MAG TPA: hypothetical protein VGX00_03220 [Thermoplasmata archaeon]|nr:hypothetical protein [Thermoplasmata archaeon]